MLTKALAMIEVEHRAYNTIKEAINILNQLAVDIKKGHKSMQSSAKMIEFFTQHMLDYHVMKNKKKNFTKDISIFEPLEALEEITDILENKTRAK